MPLSCWILQKTQRFQSRQAHQVFRHLTISRPFNAPNRSSQLVLSAITSPLCDDLYLLCVNCVSSQTFASLWYLYVENRRTFILALFFALASLFGELLNSNKASDLYFNLKIINVSDLVQYNKKKKKLFFSQKIEQVVFYWRNERRCRNCIIECVFYPSKIELQVRIKWNDSLYFFNKFSRSSLHTFNQILSRYIFQESRTL